MRKRTRRRTTDDSNREAGPLGERVYVPRHVLLALFRNAPDVRKVGDLYRPEPDPGSGNCDFKPISPQALENYRFSLNCRQIELLLSAYQFADKKTGIAQFTSFHRWYSHASHASGDDAKNYRSEILVSTAGRSGAKRMTRPALNEQRQIWLDIYERKKRRPSLLETTPVTIHVDRDVRTGRTNFVDVAIAPFFRQRLTDDGSYMHYCKVPLNFRRVLKQGGLRRVDTPNALFFLYLFTRGSSPSFTMSVADISRKIGISHYLTGGHIARAEALLQDTIQALITTRVLMPTSGLAIDGIEIVRNTSYFKGQEGERR